MIRFRTPVLEIQHMHRLDPLIHNTIIARYTDSAPYQLAQGPCPWEPGPLGAEHREEGLQAGSDRAWDHPLRGLRIRQLRGKQLWYP